jgi:cytochrome b561
MQASGQLDVLAVFTHEIRSLDNHWLRYRVILKNMKKMLIKQKDTYMRELSKSTVNLHSVGIEVLTVVLLRIHVFWDVLACCWTSGD